MNKYRNETPVAQVGYGCLFAAILLIVPAASFAVVFLWNVNAPH